MRSANSLSTRRIASSTGTDFSRERDPESRFQTLLLVPKQQTLSLESSRESSTSTTGTIRAVYYLNVSSSRQALFRCRRVLGGNLLICFFWLLPNNIVSRYFHIFYAQRKSVAHMDCFVTRRQPERDILCTGIFALVKYSSECLSDRR